MKLVLLSLLVIISVVPFVFAQEYSDSIPITISTDQETYQSGDTIIISGTVSIESQVPITILVLNPDGNIVSILNGLADKGIFQHSIKVGGSMYVNGVYEVQAQQGSQKITNTFVYTADGSTIIPEPTPEPEPISKSIVVTTDKASYSEGETIVITGEVREFYSGTPVSVIVKAPNGNLVSIINLEVSTDKKFNMKRDAGGATMKSDGVYTVTAQYGTVNRSVTTTFEFKNYNTAIPEPITINNNNFKLENTIYALENTISEIKKDNTLLKVENRKLSNNNNILQIQINELSVKVINLQNIINEQIKVILQTIQELTNK